jgi:hypothetical protein
LAKKMREKNQITVEYSTVDLFLFFTVFAHFAHVLTGYYF